MKKLHHNEVQRHFEMHHLVKVDFSVLPIVYELKGHDCVTIDMSPSFGGIARTFKECRATGHAYDTLQVYKIDNVRKTRVRLHMNPLYI